MHETLRHNLLTLIKAGAFYITEGTSLQPMSPFKWRKLVRASLEMGITEYILAAPKVMEISLPELQTAYDSVMKDAVKKMDTVNDSETQPSLFNHWTDKYLLEVKEEEMNAPDTSEETLLMLDAIVSNAHAMIVHDINVGCIIELGRQVMERNEVIDKEKLVSWLSHIGLVQIANFLANILVDVFEIQAADVPFYKKPYPKARKLFYNSLYHTLEKHSFSVMTKMNVAMTETLSYNFSNAISKITDIEE